MISFHEYEESEREQLIELLTSEHWPFHGQEQPTEESVQTLIDKGFFSGAGVKTFFVRREEKAIGLLRLFDLEDPTALFDIRMKGLERREGYGFLAVKWLTSYTFVNYPDVMRIEGHTRADNIGMRKLFHKCDYVKESYHRKAWPQAGKWFDSVGYAMLREDFENGTVTPVIDDIPF